jgi:predicted metal-binding membrane protein
VFLLAAGIYQFSPLKSVCLTHCRGPASFLTQHWRKGDLGALRMGLEHGLYCVGCCWFLMLLLFVGGIMNLVWIAGLAIFVLLEKLLPRGVQVARVSGGVMVLTGGYLLFT